MKQKIQSFGTRIFLLVAIFILLLTIISAMAQAGVCGNGECESGESCSSCSPDCGSCSCTNCNNPPPPPPHSGPVCGNGECESGESCSSCSPDCGSCTCTNCNPPTNPVCGDGICNGAETCSSCSPDCGSCPVVKKCGDGSINVAGEECEWPGTTNNGYCTQSTSSCSGNKLGTRDSKGNCNSACGCVYDSFSYSCVRGMCGAECDSDYDCNDGNPHTTDTCTGGCTCSHVSQPYCGDGIINNAESCEYPNTINNNNCAQATQTCYGSLLGTRDYYGNCGSTCGCETDPFTFSCVAGSCGATCSSGQTQTEACGTDVGECSSGTRTRTCSATTCSFGEWGACTGSKGSSAEICDGKDNDCDGLIDENLTQSCGSGECSGIKTCTAGTWGNCSSLGQDAGTCAKCTENGTKIYDPTQVSDCDDGLFCNGQETCKAVGQCKAGTSVACGDTLFCTVNERCDEATDSCVSEPKDCSGFDLLEISTCDNNPDNNPFTWDYAEGGFISTCDEESNICSQGEYEDITHTCSKELCGAECESDSDCIAGHSCDGCVCTCTASNETCDGLDNDCDGKIDEDNACGPKIISTPVKRMCLEQADEGSNIYTYDVNAIDPNDPFLTYLLVDSPDEMSIDTSSGLISWQLETEDIGTTRVIVKAEDREFTEVSAEFCPDYFHPVCAINGDTYENLCELAEDGQTAWYDGYCYDMQAYDLEICKPGSEIYPRRKFAMENLDIMNAEPICAGDDLKVLLSLENYGIFDNDDITVAFTIPELGIKRTIGPISLDSADSVSRRIDLSIPEDTPAGMYDLRVYLYAQNGDFHRIKHREFLVKQCGESSCERDNPICDVYGDC
jgi:hypothetical protein